MTIEELIKEYVSLSDAEDRKDSDDVVKRERLRREIATSVIQEFEQKRS